MIMIFALFGALVLGWQAVSLMGPANHEAPPHLDAQAQARQFILYHRLVAEQLLLHPFANGRVTLALPPGVHLGSQWDHEVVDGQLYTYTVGWQPPVGFGTTLRELGVKTACQLPEHSVTMSCSDSTRVLPSNLSGLKGMVIVGP